MRRAVLQVQVDGRKVVVVQLTQVEAQVPAVVGEVERVGVEVCSVGIFLVSSFR